MITLIPTGHGFCVSKHIGSVKNVISGYCPSSLRTQSFKAKDFQYGFELASPESIESMGEAVLVNGRCYVTSTNKHSNQYGQMISDASFYTSGIFLIPKATLPTYHIKGQFKEPIDLGVFYADLYQTIQRPFAFACVINFSQISYTAIAKAPIQNETIFDHPETYYPNPPKHQQKRVAFLVGCVADFNQTSLKPLLKQLAVVLYHNPFEGSAQRLTSHAHGLILNTLVHQIEAISPENVDEVVHVFAENSLVHDLHGEVFVLDACSEV